MGPMLKGAGDVAAPSILFLRSLTAGVVFRGIILDRGTSSSFLTGVLDGYFTGDISFLFPFRAMGDSGFRVPEGPGFGSEYITLSISSSDGWTSPSDSRFESKESEAEVTLLSCSFSDLVSQFFILFSNFLIFILVSAMLESRWFVCWTIDCSRSLTSSSAASLSLKV